MAAIFTRLCTGKKSFLKPKSFRKCYAFKHRETTDDRKSFCKYSMPIV